MCHMLIRRFFQPSIFQTTQSNSDIITLQGFCFTIEVFTKTCPFVFLGRTYNVAISKDCTFMYVDI